MKKYIKPLVVAALVISIVLIAFMTARHYSTTRTVTFTFSDVSEVLVSELLEGGDAAIAGKITKSGSTLQLNNNARYSVLYKGETGFADGSLEFDTNDGQETITIEPYYSEQRLDKMLDSELSLTQQTIRTAYGPLLDSYEIVRGNLYHRGEWYGTTLVYIGSDAFVSDSLHIVLKKVDGVWVLATPTPQISLSSITFKDIPVDILRLTNSYNPNPAPIQ